MKGHVFNTLHRDASILEELKGMKGVHKLNGHKMKFQSGFPELELKVNYRNMCEWYDTNIDLSSKILKETYDIKGEYKYTGANLMINHNVVTEQYVHSDFDDPRRSS